MNRSLRGGLVAVLTLFATVAFASAAQARLLAFKSPSGNITCVMSSGKNGSFAQCELRSAGRGYFIPRHGRVTRYDVDPYDDLAGRRFILRYGHSRRLGVFVCTSHRSRMTCRNRATGHGFKLSRERQRILSSGSPTIARLAASTACTPGTPSAERFSGLRARIPYGKNEYFSLDFGDLNWDVNGDIRVTMESGGDVFVDQTTSDPLADLYVRLDPGDAPATITASFEQINYPADGSPEISCTQSISRTVTGFTVPTRLVCNRWTQSGDNIPQRRYKPRRCSIWRANWSHAQSASFVKARWTSWGGPVARARATLVYNMGYRARIRVKAYRVRFDCTGRYRVYTRVYIKGPDGHGVMRPDRCT